MTDMQVRARANELEAEKIAVQREQAAIARAKLQEDIRHNQVGEYFTDAEILDKIGPTQYMPITKQLLDNSGEDDPQHWIRTARDIAEWFFSPLTALLSKFKK